MHTAHAFSQHRHAFARVASRQKIGREGNTKRLWLFAVVTICTFHTRVHRFYIFIEIYVFSWCSSWVDKLIYVFPVEHVVGDFVWFFRQLECLSCCFSRIFCAVITVYQFGWYWNSWGWGNKSWWISSNSLFSQWTEAILEYRFPVRQRKSINIYQFPIRSCETGAKLFLRSHTKSISRGSRERVIFTNFERNSIAIRGFSETESLDWVRWSCNKIFKMLMLTQSGMTLLTLCEGY